MSDLDRNDRKHLYNAAKRGINANKFMPEIDPVLSADSWFQRASNAVLCTLGQVGTARTMFAYGFVFSNLSATTADVRIFEGATVKLRERMIAMDTITIGYGNARSPVCKFAALERVFVQSTPAAASVQVTMSWWDAEI